MKKFLGGIIGFLMCIIVVGAVHIIEWYHFEPPKSVGHVCKSVTVNLEMDLVKASEEWFDSYMDGLMGWRVPYSYRIEKASLNDVELLEHSCVQLNYTIWPSSANQEIMSNMRLAGTPARYKYTGQIVLRWSMGNGRLTIAETMSPVQYQIQTPEFQEEIRAPQTEHYEMADDEPMTYYIRDEVLYVTYDSGKHFVEVPGGYEGVCRTLNGTYDELLAYNSYVITPEFTAFIDYSGEEATLLYSMDAGETWKRSQIAGEGFRANTFLSKTETSCYATFAVDRALGSDFYVTYKSTDLEKWERITSPEQVWSNLNCVLWINDLTGYYSRGGAAFFRTVDGGANFEDVQITVPQEITDALGFNPYDTIEKIYQEDGMIYVVVGQGDDGDYVKDGELMKALFKSTDGFTFEFVEEIADSPREAG